MHRWRDQCCTGAIEAAPICANRTLGEAKEAGRSQIVCRTLEVELESRA
jgi:hypothetical protein